MRFIRKFLQIVLVLILLIFTALAGTLVYLAYARQPMLDGRVAHASLQAEVRLVRDDWGVPHITAENETDAYFALGYAMAQDRLFQMELARRLAAGRLAEVFGPKAVPVDTVMRAFRLRPKAEETMAAMQSEFPHLHAVAEAFTAGINHRIRQESLPFEFALLLHTPEPFAPADCLSVGALLPITFADGLRSDPLASMLQQKHPDLDMNLLFPGYSKEVPVTVMESLEEAAQALAAQQPEAALAPQASLQPLEAWLAALQPFSDWFGPALGSNSWVLAGSRTKSGKPILANDPHIGFTNPSIWYEAHLRFPGFESYGYHLPLIPFPLLSHNRDHAWALTMFANDDVDLYVEEFNPDNPGQVKYKGAWTDVVTEEEVINVRFGKPVTVTVRRTPHGPVITDFLREVSGYEGPDVALAWIWQTIKYTDMEAFYRMGHARDYDAFAAAIPFVTSPGLNISYADAAGNIAWWAAGRIPVRPRHVNSKLLLDGASGNDELRGFVPFEQNPHLKNPESGCIVTANNLSTIHPVGDVPLLEGYWQPTDRAARLEFLLEQRSDWTLDTLQEVQFDSVGHVAPDMVRHLDTLLKPAAVALNEQEQAALNLMKNWEGEHDRASAPAAIYEVWMGKLLQVLVGDEMGPELFATYGTIADHWNFLKYAVQDPALPFWDDVTTPDKETPDQIVLRALRESVLFLRERCGPQTTDWAWGKIHTMTFKHPFGYLPGPGFIFNIGPFESEGGAEIVNNMLYGRGDLDFSVIAGPSTRRLIDFADITHTLTIIPTGNSGNFLSPHYSDQAQMFMDGQYRLVRLTTTQIEDNARHTLRFSPN